MRTGMRGWGVLVAVVAVVLSGSAAEAQRQFPAIPAPLSCDGTNCTFSGGALIFSGTVPTAGTIRLANTAVIMWRGAAAQEYGLRISSGTLGIDGGDTYPSGIQWYTAANRGLNISSGNWLPGATNTTSIGSTTNGLASLYIANGGAHLWLAQAGGGATVGIRMAGVGDTLDTAGGTVYPGVISLLNGTGLTGLSITGSTVVPTGSTTLGASGTRWSQIFAGTSGIDSTGTLRLSNGTAFLWTANAGGASTVGLRIAGASDTLDTGAGTVYPGVISLLNGTGTTGLSITGSTVVPVQSTTLGAAGTRWLQIFAGTSGIDSTGNIVTTTSITSSGATQGIGYTAGAGGTVTQLTSKSTGVTLNTVTGEITMNGAALAGDTTVSFVLTNSAVAGRDYIHIQHIEGGTVGSYIVSAGVSAGTATITVRNITTGSLSEAIVLKFVVFKAVTS